MPRLRVRQALALGTLLLLFSGPGRGWANHAASQSPSTIGLLAIDANPSGNTATSLGPVDGCARLEPGSIYNVDYVVDAVPQDRPMIGFDVEIRYDPSLFEAVNVDDHLLLAAVGAYSPLASLSDTLPDSDGKLRISVLDTASSTDPQANVESGAGVLARVAFRAKSPGISKIAIGLDQDPLLYPLVLDTQDEMILADRLSTASLAVGEDCPPVTTEPEIIDLGPTNQEIIAGNPSLGPTPATRGVPGQSGAAGRASGQTAGRSPAPTGTGGRSSPSDAGSPNGDDGTDTWLIALLAALVALGLAAAGAGWYFYCRSRPSPPGP